MHVPIFISVCLNLHCHNFFFCINYFYIDVKSGNSSWSEIPSHGLITFDDPLSRNLDRQTNGHQKYCRGTSKLCITIQLFQEITCLTTDDFVVLKQFPSSELGAIFTIDRTNCKRDGEINYAQLFELFRSFSDEDTEKCPQ